MMIQWLDRIEPGRGHIEQHRVPAVDIDRTHIVAIALPVQRRIRGAALRARKQLGAQLVCELIDRARRCWCGKRGAVQQSETCFA